MPFLTKIYLVIYFNQTVVYSSEIRKNAVNPSQRLGIRKSVSIDLSWISL